MVRPFLWYCLQVVDLSFVGLPFLHDLVVAFEKPLMPLVQLAVFPLPVRFRDVFPLDALHGAGQYNPSIPIARPCTPFFFAFSGLRSVNSYPGFIPGLRALAQSEAMTPIASTHTITPSKYRLALSPSQTFSHSAVSILMPTTASTTASETLR